MELVAQNAIDQIIGHAELKVARESNAPTIAPMPKRKVPASEDAVPGGSLWSLPGNGDLTLEGLHFLVLWALKHDLLEVY